MIGLYIKLFCITGTAFMLLNMAASFVLGTGVSIILESSKGLVFGFTMSAILGTIHAFKARSQAGENHGDDIYSTRQSREVKTPLSPDSAFTLLRHYLTEVRHFRLTEASSETGLLKAGTPWTLKTFGCRVRAEITKQEDGGALIKIFSRPAMPLTLVDYGENLKLVMEAAAFLRASDRT